MNERTPTTRQQLGTDGKSEQSNAEKENPHTFALAAKRFGCWAWIRGWETFGFHPQPPIQKVLYVLHYC